MGQLQLRYLHSRNMLSKLLDFYLMSDSPIIQKNIHKQDMGSSHSNPKFSPLICTISNLLSYYYTITWNEDIHLKQGVKPPKTSAYNKVNLIFTNRYRTQL